MTRTVAIIGSGPYGLSIAAHLRGLSALSVRVFGQAMSFWQNFMPKGMFLRSGWRASFLSDPSSASTLDEYMAATGAKFSTPVPLQDFVSYGKWFQRQQVPNLEPQYVASMTRPDSRFELTLADGSQVSADAVVVATGIAPFAWRPPEFAKLPRELASHSSEHQDFSGFAGKRVAVVGGGQSALESAALLQENGASVEVFVRNSAINWLGWRERVASLGPLASFLYSWTDVGPAGISQVVSRPNYFRRLPRTLQTSLARRSIRPAGAAWLRPRLLNTPLHVSRSLTKAVETGGKIQLSLDDSSTRTVEHLLFGTGYRIDCNRYDFLSANLKTRLQTVAGYPILNHSFESSIPGLHFVGAPAAWSFGPLMRFVAGTHFTARVLQSHFRSAR